MGRILIRLVALMTLGTAANATTLAAGAMYGAPTQTTAVCYLFNAGNSTVSVSGSAIVSPSGPVSLTSNTCGSQSGGTTCFIIAPINKDLAYSCKFVISPDGAAVRGTLEIRNGSSTVLQNAALR
jgi:hypothetical protein